MDRSLVREEEGEWTHPLLACLSETGILDASCQRAVQQRHLRRLVEEINLTKREEGCFLSSRMAVSFDCVEYLYHYLHRKYKIPFTESERAVVHLFFGRYYNEKKDLIRFADILDKYSARDPRLAFALDRIFAVDGFGRHVRYRYYVDNLRYTPDVGLDEKIFDPKFLHLSAVRHLYDVLGEKTTPLQIYDTLLGFLQPDRYGNDIMEMYVEFVQKHHGQSHVCRKSLALEDIVAMIEARVREDQDIAQCLEEMAPEAAETVADTEKVVPEERKEGRWAGADVTFVSLENRERLKRVAGDIDAFMHSGYMRTEKVLEVLSNAAQQGVDVEELLAIDGVTGTMNVGPNFEHRYYVHNLDDAPREVTRDPTGEARRVHIRAVRQFYAILKKHRVRQPAQHVYTILKEAWKDRITLPPLPQPLEDVLDPEIQALCEWIYFVTVPHIFKKRVVEAMAWKVGEESEEDRRRSNEERRLRVETESTRKETEEEKKGEEGIPLEEREGRKKSEETGEEKRLRIAQKGREMTEEEKIALASDEQKFQFHKMKILREQARQREERQHAADVMDVEATVVLDIHAP